MKDICRRSFLKMVTALGLLPVSAMADFSSPANIITRRIPSTGEQLPVIGMGSWITFDVGDDAEALLTRVNVLRKFFDMGGRVIDSSPMYGYSEETIGHCLKQLHTKPDLFAATKVWTRGRNAGMREMERSRDAWGVARFDLMQIHNMLDWQTHLQTLLEWKSTGRIRYIGITTSHGRRHAAMQRVLKDYPFDFVQFTYNLIDREAEQHLLPLAAEKGIAVIINRPFQGGSLFSRVSNRSLPAWAKEFDCANWAQFFLKFVVSHPAVTCAIPATSRVDHMKQNMGALTGRLPDPELRSRMIQFFSS